MNKKAIYLSVFITTILFVFSCNKENNPSEDEEIKINNVNDLQQNLTFSGAVKKNGNIPAPSTGGRYGHTITVSTPTINLSGDAVDILSIDAGEGAKIVYIQLDGVDEYFEIPIDEAGNFLNLVSKTTRSSHDIPSCMCRPQGNCFGALTGKPITSNGFSVNAKVQVYKGSAIAGDANFNLPGHWSDPTWVTFIVSAEGPTPSGDCSYHSAIASGTGTSCVCVPNQEGGIVRLSEKESGFGWNVLAYRVGSSGKVTFNSNSPSCQECPQITFVYSEQGQATDMNNMYVGVGGSAEWVGGVFVYDVLVKRATEMSNPGAKNYELRGKIACN